MWLGVTESQKHSVGAPLGEDLVERPCWPLCPQGPKCIVRIQWPEQMAPLIGSSLQNELILPWTLAPVSLPPSSPLFFHPSPPALTFSFLALENPLHDFMTSSPSKKPSLTLPSGKACSLCSTPTTFCLNPDLSSRTTRKGDLSWSHFAAPSVEPATERMNTPQMQEQQIRNRSTEGCGGLWGKENEKAQK